MEKVKTYFTIGGMDFDADEYPTLTDRVFREAWAVNEGEKAVYIDMPLARDIWRDKIRKARKPELEKLDVEFILKLERGESTDEISQRKQELRDAPAHPDIEAAQTPEELKLVQPAGLVIE